jgi:hypothetical protein
VGKMLEALIRGMGWEVADMEIDCCEFHTSSPNEFLIPGLPEDIARECLLKVSYKSHPCLRKVCRRWEKEVTDPVFFLERRKAGTTRHCVCMVQALPVGPRGGNNSSSSNKEKDATVVYGISMYDLEQRTWEWLPNIPEFPQGLPLFCRIMSFNGKLLVLGGWHPSTWEALRCTFVFNFSSHSWSRGADMPRVRSFFACGVIDGSVFVAGGHDDNKTALATADVYNLDADRWERLPDMSEERDEGAGVVLDGKFFVISGYGTNSQGQFGSSADVFDPSSGSWSRVNQMWTMSGGSSPPPNGYVVVARGELYSFHRQSLVRYCPLKNVWNSVDVVVPPEATRINPPCATSVNDIIFAMGSVLSSKAAECQGLIYRLQENSDTGVWQAIEFSEDFSGLAQTSCTVEI